MVVDPAAFDWPDADWRGRPWHEAVIYELHVGAFSEHGSFAGIERRLDHLARLGVTALELMPLADFPGRRNWGYDGVLWFAPDASYGSPEDLKRLVASAHARGLMVLLDVVYNHFGPEGNYLHRYAPQFFSAQHQTPWGGAINFDGQDARTVRDFVIHNALYWLDEYHCDGLRIDAVHAIRDDSTPDILSELAAAVRSGPGRERHVHLVLENDANQARYLGAVGHGGFDAQWNDDEHHCLHVIATGERDGYYEDYAAQPHALLQRCLTEGFAYQGEPSRHRDGARRGEPSGGLPPTAFVPFLQNHDQVGNRAAGERLPHLVAEDAPLRALTALLLLAPSPPLLFMGEEWHASQPFPYFCDFEPELAEKVRAGRRREFARFHRFAQQDEAWTLPDPGAPATFDSARLHWGEAREHGHSNWLTLYRRLLRLRHREIIPRLPGAQPGTSTFRADGALGVAWQLGDGSRLQLLANLSDRPAALPIHPRGRLVYSTHPRVHAMLGQAALAPWTTIWLLEQGRD
jgi:malto-oligosyltrehalose trehalohydrolase